LRSSLSVLLIFSGPSAFGFEGRVDAALTRGGQATPLLYTVGTNFMRVEVTATDRPYPANLLDLRSGQLIVLYPGSRSFMRLTVPAENTGVTPAAPAPQNTDPTNFPGKLATPRMPDVPAPANSFPPRVGPQAGNRSSAQPMPSMPTGGGAPAVPMVPPMRERIELTATGDKTNLLGYTCERFELKLRGEVMEIWATDKLGPFQAYQENQPPRFGPRWIGEQWGDLLKAKKLFPLLAELRLETPASPGAGPERMRFEVKSITPKKIDDKDGSLFRPPADYRELEPLPF